MRIFAAAIALSFLAIAALAASPEVEAALKAFQTAGADANRLKTLCELMQIDQQNALKADPLLEAKMDKLRPAVTPFHQSAPGILFIPSGIFHAESS